MSNNTSTETSIDKNSFPLANSSSTTQIIILSAVFVAWVVLAVLLVICIARRRRWRQRLARRTSTFFNLQYQSALGLVHAGETGQPMTTTITSSQQQPTLNQPELDLLPIAKFDSKVYSDKTICAICLDKYLPDAEIRQLACTHIFHPNCIDKWLLKRSCRCPLCNLDTRGPLGLPMPPSAAKLPEATV